MYGCSLFYISTDLAFLSPFLYTDCAQEIIHWIRGVSCVMNKSTGTTTTTIFIYYIYKETTVSPIIGDNSLKESELWNLQ